MKVSFTTTLTNSDWDDGLSGWRCSVLQVHGAAVSELTVMGERADLEYLAIHGEHGVVQWLHGDRPDEVSLTITLTEPLSPRAQVTRWQTLAILLPVVAVFLVAGLTFIWSLRVPTRGDARPDIGGEQMVTASREPDGGIAAMPDAAPTSFSISMPRGDKLYIRWKPDTYVWQEDYLRIHGIQVCKVVAALKKAHAALAQRDRRELKLIPFKHLTRFMRGKKIKLWGIITPDPSHPNKTRRVTFTTTGAQEPGWIQAVKPSEPGPTAFYDSFQLFQRPDHFSISISTTKKKGKVMPHEKLGIDWAAVKEGLAAAVKELHRGKKAVAFGQIRERTATDHPEFSAWDYDLPYRLVDSRP